ncbi:hypothetical protein BH10PAT1_BH10PAT1_4790 [soil metagenome]
MSNCEFKTECGFARFLAEKRQQEVSKIFCGREEEPYFCPRHPKNPKHWIKLDEPQLTGDYEIRVVHPSARQIERLKAHFNDIFNSQL